MKLDEEYLCNLYEFQLVTNLLYLKRKNIEWYFPPIGLLASFSINENFEAKVISKSNYNSRRRSYLSNNKECEKDIPTYDDFMGSFFCAGLLPMTKVKKALKPLLNLRKNNLLGEKPLWLGYDTNVITRAFIPQIIKILREEEMEKSIGHVIAGGVITEILRGLDQKYKSHHLLKLGKSFPEAKNFFNQPGVTGRLCRIGDSDIKILKKEHVCLTSPSKPDDLEIIRGYEKFEESRNAEIMLFSSDKNFVNSARQSALKTTHISYNINEVREYIEDNPIELDSISRIIYYGTMIFGMSKLNGADLYSIWSGKKVRDWDSGYIKVQIHDSLEDSFKKAHGALKDLEKINYSKN